MLTATPRASDHENRPLTHRDCLTAGRQTHPGAASAGRPWVQVRRNHPEGPYVLCGQVVELNDNGAEWFKVATSIGHVWAKGQSLRMCSGDGRCTCEDEHRTAPAGPASRNGGAECSS